MSLISAVLFYD